MDWILADKSNWTYRIDHKGGVRAGFCWPQAWMDGQSPPSHLPHAPPMLQLLLTLLFVRLLCCPFPIRDVEWIAEEKLRRKAAANMAKPVGRGPAPASWSLTYVAPPAVTAPFTIDLTSSQSTEASSEVSSQVKAASSAAPTTPPSALPASQMSDITDPATPTTPQTATRTVSIGQPPSLALPCMLPARCLHGVVTESLTHPCVHCPACVNRRSGAGSSHG